MSKNYGTPWGPSIFFSECPKCHKPDCYEMVDITIPVEGGYIRSYLCHECHYENQEVEYGP